MQPFKVGKIAVKNNANINKKRQQKNPNFIDSMSKRMSF